MNIRAGERIENERDIKCSRCGRTLHVNTGQRVPNCHNCGGIDFRESGGEDEEEEEEEES